MKEKTLRDEYFLWLYEQVDGRIRSFRKLSRILHDKKFTWFVKNDDNRLQDGLDLRYRFIEEKNLDETHLEVIALTKGECTVFEMMVALAERMDYLTNDLKEDISKAPKWFGELINNLGFSQFSDMNMPDWDIDENLIERSLDRLINRTYDNYGHGSLFPLKRRPPTDMSKVEIWYQLMLYLDENYGLG